MGLPAELLEQLDAVGEWGLLATNTNLTVTGWNRWLEQRTGRAAAEALGRNLFDLFPDLRTRGLDRYFRQALAGQVAILSQRLHKYILPLPLSPGWTGPERIASDRPDRSAPRRRGRVRHPHGNRGRERAGGSRSGTSSAHPAASGACVLGPFRARRVRHRGPVWRVGTSPRHDTRGGSGRSSRIAIRRCVGAAGRTRLAGRGRVQSGGRSPNTHNPSIRRSAGARGTRRGHSFRPRRPAPDPWGGEWGDRPNSRSRDPTVRTVGRVHPFPSEICPGRDPICSSSTPT